MKKASVYIIMVLCYIASNITCSLLNMLSQDSGIPMMITTLILSLIFSAAFAFLAFYIPQKLLASEDGMRYKVMSIIAIIIGSVMALSVIAAVNGNAGLTSILTNPYLLLLLLLSLLNSAFIFGITLFILYKKHYKKDWTHRL